MEQLKIIQKGEISKYKVDIDDFNMTLNDFKVELIYGYRRTVIEIDKKQMFANNGFFFSFETQDIIGPVIARCTWYIPDTDEEDGLREKVDEQLLCFIASTPCPQFVVCPACESEGRVTYTRTDESNIGIYELLTVSEGSALRTSDDLYLYVLKNNS